GDSTTRIMREVLLGIGGVRFLRALGVKPSVFHMNEGHAAFLALELIREYEAAGKKFSEALNLTRKQCHLTTHTPVEAGHDRCGASGGANSASPKPRPCRPPAKRPASGKSSLRAPGKMRSTHPSFGNEWPIRNSLVMRNYGRCDTGCAAN